MTLVLPFRANSTTQQTTWASTASAAAGDESLSIVGSFKLVSWERRTPNGETDHPFGPSPYGQLIYTAEGRVSVQLVDPRRPRFASEAFLEGSDEEVRAAFEGYFGYFGRYSLDTLSAGHGTVTHFVEGSAFPNYAGIERVWTITLEGSRLTLETPDGPDASSRPSFRVVWERLP